MFDFVRKTRAPFRRQMHEHDQARSSLWYRLRHFHPRLFIAILLLLFSLTIGFFVLKKQSSWDGKSQRGFLVVFGNDKDIPRSLSIVVVNGGGNSATVLSLPYTLELEALRGYGLYKSSSLYGLAALEKLPLTYITQTVSLQFGVDVDDVVWINDTNTYLTSSRLGNTFLSGMLLRSKSTFGLVDRYRLWRFFSSLRKDQFSSIDLMSSSVLKPVDPGSTGSTANGENRLQLDAVKLDPLMFELFSDETIRKENISVAIVNTTGELRLGTRIARALSNMGVDVISVTSTSDALDSTQLLTSETASVKSDTVNLVRRVLLLAPSQLKKNADKTHEFRSDLVLMLGKDVVQLYAGTSN